MTEDSTHTVLGTSSTRVTEGLLVVLDTHTDYRVATRGGLRLERDYFHVSHVISQFVDSRAGLGTVFADRQAG